MTKTEIVNMSLGRLGAKRINDYDASSEPQAVTVRLHYDQTVRSLLESFDWPFARKRADLSEDTETPAFEWGHQYLLPNDFLCVRESFLESDYDNPRQRWEIEGNLFLTDDDSVELKYVSNIDSVNKYDPLFTEVLVLRLAQKILPAVAGTSTNAFRKELSDELREMELKVRAKVKQCDNTTGRRDWVNAHITQNYNPTEL